MMDHPLENFVLSPESLQSAMTQTDQPPHWVSEPFRPWLPDLPPRQIDPEEPLGLLTSRFGLNTFETEVLLLGLLGMCEPRYYDLFEAIQESARKRLPTAALAFRLFSEDHTQMLLNRTRLAGDAPLCRYRLLQEGVNGRRADEGPEQYGLQTASGVLDFLLGQRTIAQPLTGLAGWLEVSGTGDHFCPPEVHQGIQAQMATDDRGIHPVMWLRGKPDQGMAQVVARAAWLRGERAICLNLLRLPEEEEKARSLLACVFRDARLHAACLVVENISVIKGHHEALLSVWQELSCQPGVRVICLCGTDEPVLRQPGASLLEVTLQPAGIAQRMVLLRQYLPQAERLLGDIEAFCQRHYFTALTLPAILQEARLELAGDDAELTEQRLTQAIYRHSQQNFGRLAQRITPVRTLNEVIVGDALREQLEEVLLAARHRQRCLDDGFSAHMRYGTGVSALFHGDSGTGKTMVAEALAYELGLSLIKVDLSVVVNKYIGETEKNLARIFDLAESDGGILFFDEADALFGQRSNVKDAKDRHANIEVSYLLQRLENYPGLVILATNNRNHLDDAFSRRFSFITRFTLPDAEQREIMWRRAWPEQIKFAAPVDFHELAERVSLSGASIRNVALLSSWLAAEDKQGLKPEHIERAVQRELAKTGCISR
ncbi:ATP-binding protein [Enterobacter roggenkampii]|uniref:ATP-binding protein n=1 Tax=Enterobacter roggenkampii TaxID=1812935 RepID=UPI002DBD6F4B|nr:AAA family ATPase [Enterobacter roggenkampii]MEB5890005.1 AAA family ATPase [Enterobacter roggenkampii]